MAVKLKPIKDQVMVVNGGVTGIGLAAARAAARAGARVMIVGEESVGVGEAARAINNAGGRADYAVAASGDRTALAAAASNAMKRFGRIDSWVNDNDRAGVVAGCSVAIPLVERGGGAIITIVDGGDAGRAIAAEVDSVREANRSRRQVAVCVVTLPAGEIAQVEPAVEAILACAVRPRDAVIVGEGEGQTLIARIAAHPRTLAAVGIGGVALAVGALIARRRGRGRA